MSIESVLRAHEQELLAHPHVRSVGIGHDEGKEVILVFVSPEGLEADADGSSAIPQRLDGFDLVVRPALQIGGTGGTQ
jgi:hypothetical protein